MKKLPLLAAFPLLVLTALASAQSMVLTTAEHPWTAAQPPPLVKATGAEYNVEIALDRPLQVIDGFGGCFNEKGWVALSVLPPEKRTEALRALFDPVQGARFNICRVPIGASDYAVNRYTLNESRDDFDMRQFSIERDRLYLIPYIKAAMQLRPDLKIWGSVWTPPTWMKTNEAFDGGSMRDDPRIYDAFALYLARFLQAYQREGIRAYAVAVQNEPKIETHYPSCLWTSRQFLVFIRDHLGPLFAKLGSPGEIWLGTIQDADYTDFPQTVLNDPAANALVSTVGFQWDGLYGVANTRSNYPDKKIMQTETECGNWYWKDGFDPHKPQNDWSYGVYTWKKVKAYLSEGANSYMLWNMVLDQEGKSIDSERPWPQNAALVVDTKTKSLIYTPMYYAFKHFSYFVEPGARLLPVSTSGSWDDVLAFRNPNGQVVVVLQNNSAREKPLSVRVAGQAFSLKLAPKSWATIKLP